MPPKSDTQVRLDSWKEIAAYLGRGERTVKRWEEERGLPVHRVPGGKGSVYAFAAELDDWLRSEADRPSQASSNSSSAATPAGAFPTPGVQPQPDLASPDPLSPNPVDPATARRTPWFSSRLSVLILSVLVVTLAVVTAAYLNNLRGLQSGLSLRSLLQRNTTRVNAASEASDPEKAQARELYLRGKYEWNKRTADSLDRALDLFTQALAHDPSFAKAYAGLADTYNLKREYGGMPEKEAYARAIVAARKAIELDDSLAEAHRSLAFALTNGYLDFTNGEKEYLKAIALDPNDPVTHLWYANSYLGFDRWDIALREMDLAQKLDPSSSAILADKGNMLFSAGKTEEALQLLKQVERSEPQFLSPHRYLSRLYFETRNYPAFLEESEKTIELSHDSVLHNQISAAKAGFARDGERGLLTDLYAAQKSSLARSEIRPTVLALTCALMGNKDEALNLIERDVRSHNEYATWLLSVPSFVALKDEPKYQELLRQLNRPPRPVLP